MKAAHFRLFTCMSQRQGTKDYLAVSLRIGVIKEISATLRAAARGECGWMVGWLSWTELSCVEQSSAGHCPRRVATDRTHSPASLYGIFKFNAAWTSVTTTLVYALLKVCLYNVLNSLTFHFLSNLITKTVNRMHYTRSSSLHTHFLIRKQ